MGHVGLTPQAVNVLGGYGARGRTQAEASRIIDDGRAIAQAGAFSLVIEGVVEPIAIELTRTVDVPTIGIGASAQCDGQVLVAEDMLGLFERTPRFVKRFGDLATQIDAAVAAYAADVRARAFPGAEQVYAARRMTPTDVLTLSSPARGRWPPKADGGGGLTKFWCVLPLHQLRWSPLPLAGEDSYPQLLSFRGRCGYGSRLPQPGARLGPDARHQQSSLPARSDEEVRRERVADIWSRYGIRIIAGIVAVLVLAGIGLWWRSHREAQRGIEGEQLQIAFDKLGNGDLKGADAALVPIARDAGPGDRALADMTRADIALRGQDNAGAARLFGAVVADGEMGAPLRDLALVRQTAAAIRPRSSPHVVVEPAAPARGGRRQRLARQRRRDCWRRAYLRERGERDLAATLFGQIAQATTPCPRRPCVSARCRWRVRSARDASDNQAPASAAPRRQRQARDMTTAMAAPRPALAAICPIPAGAGGRAGPDARGHAGCSSTAADKGRRRSATGCRSSRARARVAAVDKTLADVHGARSPPRDGERQLGPGRRQRGQSPTASSRSPPAPAARCGRRRIDRRHRRGRGWRATPVIDGGKLFAIDVNAVVHAIDANSGAALWQTPLAEGKKGRFARFGGGVSVEEGRVYATDGLGDVVALSVADGKQLWRVKPGGPLRGSPTLANGNVYVLSQDNQLFALSETDGSVAWTQTGSIESQGVFGVAAPASSQGTVVAGFSSGELNAYRYENGRTLWQDALSRTSATTSVSSLADVDADPVIEDGRVYAVGQGGRMVAVDISTGQRVWEQNFAGISTPWIAGEWLFIVTDDARLVCVARATGKVRWITQLQHYRKEKARKDQVTWFGPVLAGGKLVLTNSLGQLAYRSPTDGAAISDEKQKVPYTLPPVVANNTLYTIDQRGRITAYR